MKTLRHLDPSTSFRAGKAQGRQAQGKQAQGRPASSPQDAFRREKSMRSLSGGTIIPFGMCSKESLQKNMDLAIPIGREVVGVKSGTGPGWILKYLVVKSDTGPGWILKYFLHIVSCVMTCDGVILEI